MPLTKLVAMLETTAVRIQRSLVRGSTLHVVP